MSATPSELRCEDEIGYAGSITDEHRGNTQQSSDDIIEFLQSDTHKMHLI